MSPRILVTGAAGVVGSVLSPWFADAYPGCILLDREPRAPRPGSSSVTGCDLASFPAVRAVIEAASPDVVVHLAGNKDVFALEGQPELARHANVETTSAIAEALRGRETLVVFISSDYVFEGTAGPYRETSPTRPGTEYGRSKVAAEELLRACGLSVAIARSSSLFGFDNDFVSKVVEALNQRRPFVAYSDLVSNPTAASELFEMLRRIIDRRLTGVFHVTGREALSREQFARRIAAAFSGDPSLIKGETRQEKIRPSDLSLDSTATYQALNYHPRPLEEILRGQARQGR